MTGIERRRDWRAQYLLGGIARNNPTAPIGTREGNGPPRFAKEIASASMEHRVKQTLLFMPRPAALVVILLLAHVIGATTDGFADSAPGSSARAEPRDPTQSSDARSEHPPASDAPAEPDVALARDTAASLSLLGSVLGVCLLEALAIAVLLINARAHG